MNQQMKDNIIQRYIDKHGNENIVIEMTAKAAIEKSLDRIERELPHIFENLDEAPEFDKAPEQLDILSDIVGHIVELETSSHQEKKVIAVNEAILTGQIQSYRYYAQLPDPNYYERQTTVPPDKDLKTLIMDSKQKLGSIILELWPELVLTNDEVVQKKIKDLQAEKHAEAKESDEYKMAEAKLNLMEDFNKVSKLTALNIPQQDQKPLEYFILAEATSGVTEKVALIDHDKVKAQLTALTSSDVSTYQQYNENRDHYKLSTNAILKLPKNKKITEVQREAMALNISRMLGLETTKSTMVNHQGAPAIFIPFDKINLLGEVSKGKVMQSYLGSFEQYSHYSTINPVGTAGLQPEAFIDDFGKSLGLFYLCSDTDAIGKNSQNKALKDNSLYIFDQVLMADDKFKLDSRLSMQPTQALMRHSRHGQGRNRTLIEDSSIDKKFDSLMLIKQEQAKLEKYIGYVSYVHEKRINQLQSKLQQATLPEKKHLQKELEHAKTLQKDAIMLRGKIKARIEKIDDIMPKGSQTMAPELVKKIFVLEKLLNKPRLFADDGRPYRNPWTNRNTNTALEILPVENGNGNAQFKIKFKEKIPNDVLLMLKKQLGVTEKDLAVSTNKKELTVTNDLLEKLNEASLFPEHASSFDKDINYLELDDLGVIKQGYNKGHSDQIILDIKQYLDNITRQSTTSNQDEQLILKQMHDIEKKLEQYVTTEEDKGFAKHVLKKFQLDSQSKLQQMLPPEYDKKERINQAFNAALKLDQVGQFNMVMRKAIEENKLNDPTFIQFLTECIDAELKATNHFTAINESSSLKNLAKNAIAAFNLPPSPPTNLYVAPERTDEVEDSEDEDLLASTSAVANQSAMLKETADELLRTITDLAEQTQTDDVSAQHSAVKIIPFD
jgi:hypothetical protein